MDPRRLAPLILALGAGAGCSGLGASRPFDLEALRRDPGWIAAPEPRLVLQNSAEDRGAAALSMALARWGVEVPPGEIVRVCPPASGGGIRAGDLRDVARRYRRRDFAEAWDGAGRPLLLVYREGAPVPSGTRE